MQLKGCDLEFIQRGIQAAGLPQPRQSEVLQLLRGAPLRP
jgi:hypothetical protein